MPWLPSSNVSGRPLGSNYCPDKWLRSELNPMLLPSLPMQMLRWEWLLRNNVLFNKNINQFLAISCGLVEGLFKQNGTRDELSVCPRPGAVTSSVL
uniref:Uncharacterized protein n=1 Tax=Solanum lycopersicum TaxID=4081 RepID=A0A3Q7II14_SOLLC